MWKSGSINVLLMTLLFGSGNFLRMERGFAVGRTDVTKHCDMPEACDVDGFSDWFKVGRYCVKYFNTPANFTDAEFSCMKNVSGGHLVSVHNEKDNGQLLCTMTELSRNKPRVWLGGYQLFKTGKFRWLDGSSWIYQRWAAGEPNHIYTNEECVEMNWKVDGMWNDESCSVKKNYFCAFKRKTVFLKIDLQ
ncbi:lectin-like [Ctenopharyngodon idella]|uniref:lectin-like n=1 Tax=Ctenopharyngodon idella TaxID=7959 RepID=UPI0022317F4D|nr:lectin-like [Ctenopharyngodon idella]